MAAPLFPAAAALGASFGVLARTARVDALAAIVMSATTFAGSSQVAAVSVLGAGGSVAAAVVAALLLNSRYAPIGITVAHAFRGSPLRRLAEAQLVVDESWALSGGGTPRFDRRVLLGIGTTLWFAWVGGTAVGALVGQAVGDPAAFGLDGAFAALFASLLAAQLRERRRIVTAALGAAIAALPDPVHAAGHSDHRRDCRGRRRVAASMTAAWACVAAVGIGTVALKAVGPVGVSGRKLPARVTDLLDMVAPAILAALVITETFARGRSLVVDPRLAGVGAGLVAIAFRAPLWLVALVGAVATALGRLVS